jgi:exodeoxyribonuclease V alpha subunit
MSRNVFSPKRAEPIIAGWSGQKVIREIMAFLQGLGVSTWRAVRIYRTVFIEDHDVIQTIAANLSDHALDVRVLIGRAWRRDDFRDH